MYVGYVFLTVMSLTVTATSLLTGEISNVIYDHTHTLLTSRSSAILIGTGRAPVCPPERRRETRGGRERHKEHPELLCHLRQARVKKIEHARKLIFSFQRKSAHSRDKLGECGAIMYLNENYVIVLCVNKKRKSSLSRSSFCSL